MGAPITAVPPGYRTTRETADDLATVLKAGSGVTGPRVDGLVVRMIGLWLALGHLSAYVVEGATVGRVPQYAWGEVFDAAGTALENAGDLTASIVTDTLTGLPFGDLQGRRGMIPEHGLLHVLQSGGADLFDALPEMGADDPVERAARQMLAAEGKLTQRGIGRYMARERLGEDASPDSLKALTDSLRHLVKLAQVEEIESRLGKKDGEIP